MLSETSQLVLNNSWWLSLVASILGAGAGVAGAAFAIPSIADRIQPPPVQNSLADYMPFIKLMPDGATIACIDNIWIQVVSIGGAELTLAPYQDGAGTGRYDLFRARQTMLDDAFKTGIDEIRFFQIKTRANIPEAPPHVVKALQSVQARWNGRFQKIHRLRNYAVLSVTARTYAEAQATLERAVSFLRSTMAHYDVKLLAEPENPDVPGALENSPLALIARIASPISAPTPRARNYADRVSHLLTADRVSFRRNEKRGVIRFSDGRTDRYATIIGVRDCGDKTAESIMRQIISLPIEMIVHQIVRPHDPNRDLLTLKIEESNAPLMRLSTNAAYEIQDVLAMVEGQDSMNRATLHDYACSIIVYGDTPEDCFESEGKIHAALSTAGATSVREGIHAQATWFSQFPGDKQIPRTFRYLSTNVASNLFLQRPNEGILTSNWAQRPICFFPTVDDQPYAFQFHAEPSSYSPVTMQDKETVAHFVVIGPTGTGKAQPLDRKVQTPAGPRALGELAVGDPIFGDDGRVHRVTGVHPQGVKPNYRVIFADGRSTECCDEHLWTVLVQDSARSPGRRAMPYAWRTMPLKDIIALGPDNARRRVSVPLPAPVDYPVRDLPLDPYTLGALLAEASFSPTCVRLSTSDREIVDAIAAKGLTVTAKSRSDYYIASETIERRGRLSDRLRALGLWNAAEDARFIPASYKTAGVAQRQALLQGLMDAGGEIGRASEATLVTTSAKLRDDVIELARSLGHLAQWSGPRAVYRTNGPRRLRKTGFLVTIKASTPADLFLLPRKREIADAIGRDRQLRLRIAAVEKIGEAEMACISVSNPRRLYLTDDYIVTHNTVFVSFAAAMAMSIPNLRVFMFDRLNGVESFVRCSGGDYLTFEQMDRKIEMNPLLLGDTPSNREFLRQWLQLVGDASDANDYAEIARAIETIFDPNLDDQYRTLDALYNVVFEAGGRMKKNMQPWVDPTQYGNYFNGARDSLDLKSKRLIGLDMTTVLNDSRLAPVVLDYIIHRIRMVSAETGDPVLIFIDETAPMIEGSPGAVRFRDRLLKVGLREGRKMRQAFGLAFQNPGAIASTGIGDIIQQQCPTMVFFRNTNANPDDYRQLGLNEAELSFVLGAEHRDLRYAALIKKYTTGESAVVNLDMGALGPDLKIFSSGRPAVLELNKCIGKYGSNPDNFLAAYLNGEFARKTTY